MCHEDHVCPCVCEHCHFFLSLWHYDNGGLTCENKCKVRTKKSYKKLKMDWDQIKCNTWYIKILSIHLCVCLSVCVPCMRLQSLPCPPKRLLIFRCRCCSKSNRPTMWCTNLKLRSRLLPLLLPRNMHPALNCEFFMPSSSYKKLCPLPLRS